MRKITIGQIEMATSGRLLCGDRNDAAHGVSTDTRNIREDDVFFALCGQQFDGHEFLSEAAGKGVKNFVISNEKINLPLGANVIVVENTEKALQDLAKWYLSTLHIKKIGITGSTGKTSTKDILNSICGETFKTAKTLGNLNNHIGVPLTVFSFEEDTQVAIIEMGTEKIGEIHVLADIVKPDIAIITNIGISHIETFGSRENILKGKMEITDFFKKKCLLIVNEESDLLSRENVSGDFRLATIGGSGKNDFILSDIDDLGENGVAFTLERAQESHKFQVNIPGRHNAINASLAIAAAMELGMTMKQTEEGLKKVLLTEKRLNIKGKNGLKVIDDTYNASPDSMRAGIDVLLSTKGMRKVAILGDMLGLGESSSQYHSEVGAYAAQKGIDLLIAIGERAEYIAKAAVGHTKDKKVLYFKDKETLLPELKKIITPGDVILVKGSRGMAMDHIVKKIME